jgi:hypothetical protein
MPDSTIISLPLKKPIVVRGEEVKELKLRTPCAGDLRDISLMKIHEGQFSAIAAMLSHISLVRVTVADLYQMGLPDQLEATQTAMCFFAPTETEGNPTGA